VVDSAITFTRGEVTQYYATRVPHLKQGRAGEWRGGCPIHKGQRDSFAVQAETGLWTCFSTCDRGGDILELEMRLTGADFKAAKAEVFRLVGRSEPEFRRNGPATNGKSLGLAPSKPTEPTGTEGGWREIERYPYQGMRGELLYEVIRYRKPDGRKDFRQCRPDGRGGVIPNLDGIERVPYRLPRVLNADTVYLPEGEKDVHTLESWGLVASCNPGGTGGSHLYRRWADYFRSRNVVILPDNDKPGWKHAVAVAGALLGVAASLRIVELPGLPPKGDVTDWRDAGGTRGVFCELTERTAPIDTEGLSELCARWGVAGTDGGAHVEVTDPWPKPEPIQCELPAVQSFSEALLPDSLRPLVSDVAERMQVPLDYPAAAAVLCLAGAVNRRAVIQPKANDTGWVEVPNLWGGIIAPPGFMKSPVINAATRPLELIQTEWRREHEESLKAYAREKEECELRRAAWKEQYKAASKRGGVAPERPEEDPTEPKLRRLIVNDATFEALHQTMSENPAGILLIRDELTGWLSRLDQEQYGTERGFALQAWNGNSAYDIIRIGRGTIHVDACCMSVLGGIQPSRLRSYLVDALEDGPGNDGLIQRFQLLVWPETSKNYEDVDRAPNAASEERAAQVFRKLVALDPTNPIRYRFASDAQELFTEWRSELELRVRGNELHPALISHLSKYRGLMPNLALLFHLAETAGGENDGAVTLRSALRAVEWCEYLETHARRVYSCVVTPQWRAARELANKIKQRKIGADGEFCCRDVYVKGWSGLDTSEMVKRAIEVLRDLAWIREARGEAGPAGGRPSDRYEVNPGVWNE